MFGNSKRRIENVNFVQPLKGEVYFYTPIAFSREESGTQVFKDSDLALAGKLKLIFERENMTWFEVREEKSIAPSKGEKCFALYYYPQRLVASRVPSFHEQATLQDVRKLFEFIVTENQTRFAEVQQDQSPSAYGSVAIGQNGGSEAFTIVTEELYEEKDAIIKEHKRYGTSATRNLSSRKKSTYRCALN